MTYKMSLVDVPITAGIEKLIDQTRAAIACETSSPAQSNNSDDHSSTSSVSTPA